MHHRADAHGTEPINVRCTHCRTRFVHRPRDPHACLECGSQLAMYGDTPIMVARNASDGLPLHKLDPKKKRVLIPRF